MKSLVLKQEETGEGDKEEHWLEHWLEEELRALNKCVLIMVDYDLIMT